MAPTLASAPEEVLDTVLAFCDYSELFSCSHVSELWHRRSARSVPWRHIAEADFARARGTQYQIVATPVTKRATLTASFNTSRLYTMEVRTRQHLRDEEAMGGASLGRQPSSTCFSTGGSTARLRLICMRFIAPLRFSAGEAAAAALARANEARRVTVSSPSSSSEEEKDEQRLPLWEDGSISRPGVLLSGPHDQGVFCYYAATLQQPWCTVLMDRLLLHDRLLFEYMEQSRATGSGEGFVDFAFRVEELPVMRNDPRDPSPLVKPAQPCSIRIGVIEETQLPAYHRGLHRMQRGVLLYSPTDGSTADSSDGSDSDVPVTAAFTGDSVWGPVTDNAEVTWTHTGSGVAAAPVDEAAAAEAEVAAWIAASVQEASATDVHNSSRTKTVMDPQAAWAMPPSSSSWGDTGARAEHHRRHETDPFQCGQNVGGKGRRHGGMNRHDDDSALGVGRAAYAIGDTTSSFGYDTEGSFIAEDTSYPLGAPLRDGDVVHLQFFHQEDVIVVTRNAERLGTLVADAFSDGQRWCMAVSLQNCGVRFLPPRLN